MSVQKIKPHRPVNEAIDASLQGVEPEADLVDARTPDSYDPHITPAETAARKEHEGAKFKHLDPHPDGSDSIDESKGFTVDKEGLVDNFAIEPEMYYDVPGDAEKKKLLEDNEQPNQPAP
jgi:rhodanese-related sulfurtransferase